MLRLLLRGPRPKGGKTLVINALGDWAQRKIQYKVPKKEESKSCLFDRLLVLEAFC